MPEFQFANAGEFFAMGGYALYVWTSYAIFAAAMALNLIQPSLARRRFFRRQLALARRNGPARRPAGEGAGPKNAAETETEENSC